jgi:hypothetical protein
MGVEVGFVAELETRDRAAAERCKIGPGLGGVERRLVVGEVEAEDHLRPQVVGKRARGGQPAGRQRVAVGEARRDPGRGHIGLIGAVAADPQHRCLTGVEVAYQRLEHRVDRRRIVAGVRADPVELDRQAEEPAGDRPAGRAEREVQALRRRARVR